MKTRKANIIIVLSIVLIITIVGCSTSKNTSQTRWWHSFNAKYNTYYNGSVAYFDGYVEKESGNKDNYTEILPLFAVGNKTSKDLGKGNFDRAIEKCEKAIKRHSIKRRPVWNKSRKKTEKDIAWLKRREYNPFLWKAWLLMGKAQFQKGEFEESAATFSYMSRLYADQPAIYGKVRAWLARCYTELGWIYDAEDVITKMRRDSMDWRAVGEWNCTYADYYIRQGKYEEAIPFLRKMIKRETRKKQKAREWFIMGQMLNALEKKQEAYKAYQRVTRLNPPYETEFNARIAQTEVMAGGHTKQMVNKLKRMAASDKNAEYLDQVYYAIGNIYLTQRDTVNTIASYERGVKKATRSGIEKGVLLLHLGNIYWQKEKYGDARRCYGEAIGLLDKDRKDYEQLSERSKVLDELVPFTDGIQLQDSLQNLAKMSEPERNKAIDRVINALKEKEKEEKRATEIANVDKKMQQQGAIGNNTNLNNNTNTTSSQGLWYFYNPITVNQGKSTFQKQWGKRDNVDNWQRVNKTVVSLDGNNNGNNTLPDSTEIGNDNKNDSIKNIADSTVNDPHKREYYLEQIPFTDEQIKASNMIIEDGLFNSGVIFKDKLDNLNISEKNLVRLVNNYLDFEKMPDAYYHLFLLYSRMGQNTKADSYLSKLKKEYPDNQWTILLSDPYYAENAKFGIHLEDSLYANTYDAFKSNNLSKVKTNSQLSKNRFPMGKNRDKFIFIDGLRQLNDGDANGCISNMKEVLEKYPKSDVSEMAGMILKGVQSGRKLRGGKFDIGDIWNRRNVVLNDSDTTAIKKLNEERNTNFTFMLVYKTDTLNENQLLYDLAKYNFSNFLVRNFDLNIIDEEGYRRMEVNGFLNYDEALQYARKLYSDKSVSAELTKCRSVIISEKNLQLIGKEFSYKDYDKFYDKHFAPLKITKEPLLINPEPVNPDKQLKEQEIRQDKIEEEKEQKENKEDKDNFYDDLEDILNE